MIFGKRRLCRYNWTLVVIQCEKYSYSGTFTDIYECLLTCHWWLLSHPHGIESKVYFYPLKSNKSGIANRRAVDAEAKCTFLFYSAAKRERPFWEWLEREWRCWLTLAGPWKCGYYVGAKSTYYPHLVNILYRKTPYITQSHISSMGSLLRLCWLNSNNQNCKT